MRGIGAAVAWATVVAAALPALGQTTTGRLVGSVVDHTGAPLTGVTVTIESPALIGGPQTRISDDQGDYSFVGIAPGEYTVRTALAGFLAQERDQVKVPLGGAAALTIAMPAGAFTGEIEVVDEAPVVDPTQVNIGQVFDQRYMQDSAIGSTNRDYLVVVNQAAGVTSGSWGPPQSKVFGSTIGENAYFIDGMDTTDPATATATVRMNFDAVDEIQLLTGGFEAEHGRATGGIINVLTKSGGNRFSGALDLRYRDDSFQESGDHFDASELGSSFTTPGCPRKTTATSSTGASPSTAPGRHRLPGSRTRFGATTRRSPTASTTSSPAAGATPTTTTSSTSSSPRASPSVRCGSR